MEIRPSEASQAAFREASEDGFGEAEAIAFAYHRAARGDAWRALVAAIADALVDLDAAERRIARQDRLISRGYARGWAGAGGGPPGSARPMSRDASCRPEP